MKHNFCIYFITGILLLSLTSNAFAQVDTMKTLPAITVYSNTSSANISQQVVQAFQKEFKDATNTRWYQLNKNYLVTFIQNDLNNRALYKKSGQQIYHISYGTEQNLPQDVLQLVKRSYDDYNITRAINVHQEGRNIWVVNLEGLKKLKIVRVEDGEIEEVESYQKTN